MLGFAIWLLPRPPVDIRIRPAADGPAAAPVLQTVIQQPTTEADSGRGARITTQQATNSATDGARAGLETHRGAMRAAAGLRYVDRAAGQQAAWAGLCRGRGTIPPFTIASPLKSGRRRRAHECAGLCRDHRTREPCHHQRDKKSIAAHPVTARNPAQKSGLAIVVTPIGRPHGACYQHGRPGDNPDAGNLPAQIDTIRCGQQSARLRAVRHDAFQRSWLSDTMQDILDSIGRHVIDLYGIQMLADLVKGATNRRDSSRCGCLCRLITRRTNLKSHDSHH